MAKKRIRLTLNLNQELLRDLKTEQAQFLAQEGLDISLSTLGIMLIRKGLGKRATLAPKRQ